ncbi:YkgJ family cysteine cluster protein [Moellerella wisconsensis]|uniref:YkgJ family cysteine cluster protein n=1 Tax=Moellerella wisconsensis TaxID=158849 RepID=A0A9Q8Q486_9GAMM|nr:YkgJ family cysteine cluster protein [Moellerella wisconsensis]UNH31393.1 YkgJ family cysteine cluster protein [Moellerella wisconsensis]
MENINFSFPCNKCGACCRHVNRAKETQFLDRADGVCRYYDEINKLCSIYNERPDICRVDRQYLLNYHKQYTWREFIEINKIACQIILDAE